MPTKKSSRSLAAKHSATDTTVTHLLGDVREIIVSAQQTVSRGVNAALVILYWKIGHRIRQDILKEKRADYGDRIVSTLSQQLAAEFGSGFSRFNLSRMIFFAEALPDPQIVSAPSTQFTPPALAKRPSAILYSRPASPLTLK